MWTASPKCYNSIEALLQEGDCCLYMFQDTAEFKLFNGVETTPQLCTRTEGLTGFNGQFLNSPPSKLQYSFFIIKFPYNTRSDKLKQLSLSEII